MSERAGKVFVDSNMIIFAAEFRRADVFAWINQLYGDIYIHADVYEELLFPTVKAKVDNLIDDGSWILFDPCAAGTLSAIQQDIYQQRLIDVKKAFQTMNMQRRAAGKLPKTVSNLGEIATIAACMMVGAAIICSNDFDIRTVVEQEDYRISVNDKDVLLAQDSAEDFCTYCFQAKIATRKLVRSFYKTVIVESRYKEKQLIQLDERLDGDKN